MVTPHNPHRNLISRQISDTLLVSFRWMLRREEEGAADRKLGVEREGRRVEEDAAARHIARGAAGAAGGTAKGSGGTGT